MAQRLRETFSETLSDTYRGFHVLIETVSDDGQSLRVQRTITRQLGERVLTVDARCETCIAPQFARETLADALRDAREAVDRLLGGWHPAYAQMQSSQPPSAR
ncbi:DNA-binding protein [Paraburkholderia rhynchosiae]|uniref:DNA-binding protein n=1 Tax=Paraburkholderia rhynchosiae TaxID=487049 RepID=A0A2N7WA59_9BURK|nr:DNA-binding protein [Paraburkholderia rhynchosiae]PMS26288.1 DNA-binding protein [Paraburkholderia rhynchosiae]CAB3730006.1 hypothetical protein LMG27174_05707 [Paraburkholderia rhynchosiae]